MGTTPVSPILGLSIDRNSLLILEHCAAPAIDTELCFVGLADSEFGSGRRGGCAALWEIRDPGDTGCSSKGYMVRASYTGGGGEGGGGGGRGCGGSGAIRIGMYIGCDTKGTCGMVLCGVQGVMLWTEMYGRALNWLLPGLLDILAALIGLLCDELKLFEGWRVDSDGQEDNGMLCIVYTLLASSDMQMDSSIVAVDAVRDADDAMENVRSRGLGITQGLCCEVGVFAFLSYNDLGDTVDA